MRNFLKSAVFKTLYFANVQGVLRKKKSREGRITLLCLHRVSKDFDYFFDPIKPDNFEALIKYVVKYYDVISLAAIGQKAGKKPRLVLSFDDGYYDFYSNVLPVLKRYSIPANHNIVTDIVNGEQKLIWTEKLNFLFNHFVLQKPENPLQLNGELFPINGAKININNVYINVLRKLFALEHQNREAILNSWLALYKLTITPQKMMGWSEIRECAENGVDFGSHTRRHTVLTSVKNKEELHEELTESKNVIEKYLNRQVVTLAPPNGLCNDYIIQEAEKAGYKYILGIGECSGVQESNIADITFLSRLNLISESNAAMILRVEELQSNIKRYGRL